MSQLTRLMLPQAFAAVLTLPFITPAIAQQQAQGSSEETLQTVVVTGSLIKRTDTETPSPTNVFNSDAPVDLQTYGGGVELHYDAALHQDGAVGRFFMLGATYRF